MKLILKIVIIILNLISKTWRIKLFGEFPESPAIIVFWHGVMLPNWKIFSNKMPFAVISTSKDGQILVDLLEKWGFSFIRGSSSQKGKEVLENIVELAPKHFILMTPDGPRGPKMKMKAGAVVAAHRSSVPLHYLTTKILSKKVFPKSWDSFELPLPFSKIEIQISKPIFVPSNLSKDEINDLILDIESKMNKNIL